MAKQPMVAIRGPDSHARIAAALRIARREVIAAGNFDAGLPSGFGLEKRRCRIVVSAYEPNRIDQCFVAVIA
jgi:hypothetical protein